MAMWDDVIIGIGKRGCSATRVFDIEGEHSISHNDNSYWINDVYLGLGMTIYKNTDEEQKLTKMIEDQVGLDAINLWLEEVLIKHISVDKLKRAVNKALGESFNAGKNLKMIEMREVLGLND